MNKLLVFLKHELLELLPPTIYFLVVFHVIAFARALMIKQYGITLSSTAAATIGALIVGKSILIADKLPVMNWFRQDRLVINVIWRTLVYVLIVLVFQFLEELIPLISKYGTISGAIGRLFEEINWYRFWATHIIFIVFLIFFNLATAVIDTFGRDELLNVFFGTSREHLKNLD